VDIKYSIRLQNAPDILSGVSKNVVAEIQNTEGGPKDQSLWQIYHGKENERLTSVVSNTHQAALLYW
jgi:hypothetical protein